MILRVTQKIGGKAKCKGANWHAVQFVQSCPSMPFKPNISPFTFSVAYPYLFVLFHASNALST
jgi:hypothetical protein